MADTQRVIDIVFNGIDNVSDISGKIGTNLTRVGGVIEDIAHPFAILGQNILKVEAAISALALGGLAYAITKAIDFEAASADLNKVLGDESARLGEAQNKALELSQAYGVSSSEILQSMANFKQAGFDLNESMTLTKSALDLVIAGDLDAAEASDILVASLKGFKAPAEDSVRLTDLLNEVSNTYATNVRELGTGMAALSPIAKGMGFSMEETAGILTPVIEIFRSGDEAANALKTGLLKLIDDSKPVRDALDSIGVSQKDANGALRSGKDILHDVSVAFQGLDQNQKMYVASQLVGIHQAGKMVEVFDGLGKSTEVTAAAMNAAGSAANEVKIRLETAEVAVKRFATGFENLGIEVGKEFLEAAKDIVQGGTDIETTLQELVKDDTFAPIFDRLRSYGTEFGDLLKGIAAAMPEAFEMVDFEGLLESLDNLKGSFRGTFEAIFGDLDLTKPEDLAKAIQKVVDTITTLTNITSGIIERINPLIELFVDWTEGVNKWDANSQRAAGNRLADAMIIEKFGGIFGTILIALTGKADALDDSLSQLDIMGDPFSTMVIGAKDASEAVGEASDEARDLHGELALLGSGPYLIALAVDTATAKEDIDEVFDYMVDAGRKISEGMKEIELLDKSRTIDDMSEIERIMLDASTQINEDLKIGGGVKFQATADEASINQVKATLDAKLPKEHKIEVDLQKEMIKAQAQVITATLESETKKWEAMFNSVNVGIESTGQTMSSFWDTLAGGNLDIGQQMHLERYIDDENRRRQQQFDLQKQLTEQQIDLTQLKIDALQRGDALITIDGAGLQPHLEGFMFEVLEAIQVRVNATGAEFLLGI
jgi:TP901 family phage tail tape measure protein